MNLKDTLIRVLKAAEEVHYQNTVYRGILEMKGPRNWQDDYALGMQDNVLRRVHHEKQGFRKAFELLAQQDDPEQLIQALLRIVPTNKDLN
jgi:hypothetical protein